MYSWSFFLVGMLFLAVSLPILLCYALVELQMSHKAIFQPETMASSDANRVGHIWMNDTADYRESELTGQYSHLCPVCGEDILFMKQDNE